MSSSSSLLAQAQQEKRPMSNRLAQEVRQLLQDSSELYPHEDFRAKFPASCLLLKLFGIDLPEGYAN